VAETKSSGTPAADKNAAAKPVEGQQAIAGDASVTKAPVRGDAVVTEGQSAPFSTKPGDVPVDPRSGKPFGEGNQGLKGVHGVEALAPTGSVVPGVDPDRIPAEVTPGVSPDAGGDELFAAALAKAPSLTREFVDKMGLTAEDLERHRPLNVVIGAQPCSERRGHFRVGTTARPLRSSLTELNRQGASDGAVRISI
jgi:hypothetical protein